MSRINLKGKRFGRLLVLKFARISKHNTAMWKVKCGCGNTRVVYGASLRRGLTKSCGCLASEMTTKRNKIFIKHGFKRNSTGIKSNFYQVWSGLMNRCRESNKEKYPNYGGRGIKVCISWLKFENFKDDMWISYQNHIRKYGKQNTSLGRKDNDDNYSSSNCKWETWDEQANNRRTIKDIVKHLCSSCNDRLVELKLVKRG
ncbi:MAG: hypothetical protein ACREBR_04700 [bacterium]